MFRIKLNVLFIQQNLHFESLSKTTDGNLFPKSKVQQFSLQNSPSFAFPTD